RSCASLSRSCSSRTSHSRSRRRRSSVWAACCRCRLAASCRCFSKLRCFSCSMSEEVRQEEEEEEGEEEEDLSLSACRCSSKTQQLMADQIYLAHFTTSHPPSFKASFMTASPLSVSWALARNDAADLSRLSSPNALNTFSFSSSRAAISWSFSCS
ncbi:hypothetical protein JZ751_020357, partial [Albula glossodonta]